MLHQMPAALKVWQLDWLAWAWSWVLRNIISWWGRDMWWCILEGCLPNLLWLATSKQPYWGKISRSFTQVAVRCCVESDIYCVVVVVMSIKAVVSKLSVSHESSTKRCDRLLDRMATLEGQTNQKVNILLNWKCMCFLCDNSNCKVIELESNSSCNTVEIERLVRLMFTYLIARCRFMSEMLCKASGIDKMRQAVYRLQNEARLESSPKPEIAAPHISLSDLKAQSITHPPEASHQLRQTMKLDHYDSYSNNNYCNNYSYTSNTSSIA